jgi:hypothetical protein
VRPLSAAHPREIEHGRTRAELLPPQQLHPNQRTFSVMQRVFVQLTREDAMFFALLENIGEEEREDYIELMMGGFVQVVLLSKRAALLEVMKG